jgi:hypothetical protein
MNSEQLITDFNDGDYESSIKPLFNDIITFLRFATKHDFIDELLLDNIPHDEFGDALPYLDELGKVDKLDYDSVPDNFRNELLSYKLEKNPQETLNYITNNLINDVYVMNGGYYLYVKDRTELADLFESGGRDTSPHDYAKAVLGEDSWEPYWETTDDVYRDVIEDLNEENLGNLAEYIIKQIGGQEFSLEDYDDELFHTFSTEQGTEGTFQITKENVMRLIKDESAMKEMLKGDLSDLKSELYSIHNNAYNSAYETEIYNDVWSELSTYFVTGSWETDTKERYDGKKIYHEYIKINDFPQVVYDFLSDNKGGTYNESFMEYFGSYVGVIATLMDNHGDYDWLSFRVPDYPDWGTTKKNINDYFTDYI